MPQAPDWYYEKPTNVRLRTGAGGVVARLDEHNNILIALIRDRGDHEYVLPKGGVEDGETLQQAAAREIKEEAGFRKLQCLDELGIGQRMAGKKQVWQTTHYFLFLTTETEGKPTDHRDWQVHWFPLHKLPELYWPEQHRLLADNQKKIESAIRAATR